MLNLSKVALLSTPSGESPCLAALPLHDVKVNRLRLPVIRTHSKVYMTYLSETLFLFHRSLSRLRGYPEGPGETPTPTPPQPPHPPPPQSRPPLSGLNHPARTL